jgi:orotate phosphoribosyltransferase
LSWVETTVIGGRAQIQPSFAASDGSSGNITQPSRAAFACPASQRNLTALSVERAAVARMRRDNPHVSDILDIFKRQGALLEGHFLLSSGLHSAQYLQCARVLMDTKVASELGAKLAAQLRSAGVTPDVIVGPAMGGIVIGHEVARGFGCRSLFTEREGTAMTLRRGFTLEPGETVVVVEDVVTTGKSTREVIAVIEAAGAKVIGVASLVDRSAGRHGFEVPLESLLKINVNTWGAAACPLCAAGSLAVKPGSRPAS